jgi:cell division cycle 14
MPFRDAGYSQADYSLTIQDVVYGVWKAKEENLVGLKEFSLEEYEKYERVDMGDFNWITPDFLAFASPQHQPTHVFQPNEPLYAQLPRSMSALQRDRSLPTPFKNVLTHFAERGIGLVVRLNSELYSPSYFTALGMKHLDMIFDDGTCPPLNLVRKFVNLAHTTIGKRKGIAVHCKAGLGRTGCLIGAYLIYRHGFTANEIIAFMRFMRPGMVVGPQQHWLHLNQGTFREWWFEDTVKEKLVAAVQPTTPTRLHHSSSRRLASNGQTFTPPNGERQASLRRSALGEITNNEQAPTSTTGCTSSDDMKGSLGVADENLPAPTPGQPRKTSKIYGGRRIMTENQPFDIKPDTEIISMQRSTVSVPDDAGEEDYALRMLSRKASQSPISRSGKRRAISCTTTTTTTTKWDGLTSAENSDLENRPGIAEDLDLPTADRFNSPTRPRTPNGKSGNGIGSLSVGKRSSPVRRSTEGKTSVRKTSGRVGSVGTQAVRPHKAS